MGNEANGAEKDKGGEEQEVAEQRQRIRFERERDPSGWGQPSGESTALPVHE